MNIVDRAKGAIRGRKGFTLVESLVAALIIALSLAALVMIWTTSLTQIEQARRREVAAQLVRHDLEKAKVQGFWNLPVGGMVVVDGIEAGRWVGPIEYYDRTGQLLDQGDPVEDRCFALQRVITDYGVARSKQSSSYLLLFDSTRVARTLATSCASGEVQAEMGINIVRGGV